MDKDLIFARVLLQTSSQRGDLDFTGVGSCESCLLKSPNLFFICNQLSSQENIAHCASLLFQVNHSIKN